MNQLAAENGIPGADTRPIGFREKTKLRFKLLGAKSLKPDALIAPFRAIALETYQQMNLAIARSVIVLIPYLLYLKNNL